jgi:protein O-mannosyl-transferase
MKHSSMAEDDSRARVRRLLSGLALALLVALVYAPVWKAGYIWDDNVYLTANSCIVGHKGLREIWTTWEAQICPLTQTTYWVIHRAFGLHPLPYHLVNVIQHGACALLLWRVLGQLRVRGAWLGAALWALHPVQVESVAWVTEMRNTQSGVFFLLCISAFLRTMEAPHQGREPGRLRRDQGLVLLYALLAMASKSSTVVLPAVLALCAWWVGARWQRRHAGLIVAVGLLAAVAGGVSIAGQSTDWTHSQTAKLAMALPWSFLDRILNATHAVGFYLGKLLWPHPLIAIYPRAEIEPGRVSSWLPAVALILGIVLLIRQRHGRVRPALFALLYFGIALLPALGLINFSFLLYATVADRFQYLASMGPLALAAAALASVPKLWPRLGARALHATAAAVLVLWGLLTWKQAGRYECSAALWSHTLAENPRCWAACNFLGSDKERQGDHAGAIAYWDRAISLFADNVQAHLSLGDVLARMGRNDEALVHAHRAVAILPTYAVAHDSLANVLRSCGRIAEAAAEYDEAARLDPDFVPALASLAWLRATSPDPRLRDPDRAMACAARARELSVPDPTLLRTQAAAYAAANRFDDAEKAVTEALALTGPRDEANVRVLLQSDLARYRSALPVIDPPRAPPSSAPALSK